MLAAVQLVGQYDKLAKGTTYKSLEARRGFGTGGSDLQKRSEKLTKIPKNSLEAFVSNFLEVEKNDVVSSYSLRTASIFDTMSSTNEPSVVWYIALK